MDQSEKQNRKIRIDNVSKKGGVVLLDSDPAFDQKLKELQIKYEIIK